MHLSVVQFFLVSPEPIPFRTHLSTKTAHIRIMSGCQVIAMVTSPSSLELTFCIIWNNWSFSTPTMFFWFSSSLTCFSSPSCYVVCWVFISFLTLKCWNIRECSPCSWFCLCWNSLSQWSHAVCTLTVSKLILLSELLSNSRLLEVHLISTLNLMFPDYWSSSCGELALSTIFPLSYSRNNQWKHFGICLSKLMWVRMCISHHHS